MMIMKRFVCWMSHLIYQKHTRKKKWISFGMTSNIIFIFLSFNLIFTPWDRHINRRIFSELLLYLIGFGILLEYYLVTYLFELRVETSGVWQEKNKFSQAETVQKTKRFSILCSVLLQFLTGSKNKKKWVDDKSIKEVACKKQII